MVLFDFRANTLILTFTGQFHHLPIAQLADRISKKSPINWAQLFLVALDKEIS